MTDKMRSCVKGLILGLFSSPLPAAKREPVAFLYGHMAEEGETPTHTIEGVDYVGAELPNVESVLTDEVKEQLPFAFIFYFNGSYYVTFTQTAPYYLSSTKAVYAKSPNKRYRDRYTGWTLTDENKDFNVSNSQYGRMIWTSHDILNKDGSVYLAATKPVPVYE